MIGLKIVLTGCVMLGVILFFRDEIEKTVSSDGLASIATATFVMSSFLSIPIGFILWIWVP